MDLSQVEMSNGVAVADTRRLGRQLLPVLLKHVAWNGSGLEDDQDFGRNVGRTWEFVKRLHTARRIKRLCPSRRQNAEVVALPEVVATWLSEDALSACRSQRGVQAVWAAAVSLLSDCGTRRDSEQRRGSDAASCGGLSTERLAEQGARGEPPGEESAASGLSRGGLGSPRGLIARWRHGIKSDLGPTAARSQINQEPWGSSDMRLLKSRSPGRDASTDRKWRWPVGLSEQETEGLHRGHRRTDNPVPSQGDKSLEGRTKYDGRNYHPTNGTAPSRQRRKRTRYARS